MKHLEFGAAAQKSCLSAMPVELPLKMPGRVSVQYQKFISPHNEAEHPSSLSWSVTASARPRSPCIASLIVHCDQTYDISIKHRCSLLTKGHSHSLCSWGAVDLARRSMLENDDAWFRPSCGTTTPDIFEKSSGWTKPLG